MKGKVLLCDTLNDAEPALLAGAAGIVMQEERAMDFAVSFPLPATFIGVDDGDSVFDYIKKTRYKLTYIIILYLDMEINV